MGAESTPSPPHAPSVDFRRFPYPSSAKQQHRKQLVTEEDGTYVGTYLGQMKCSVEIRCERLNALLVFVPVSRPSQVKQIKSDGSLGSSLNYQRSPKIGIGTLKIIVQPFVPNLAL
jgi:hypothetical protein